MSAEIKTQQVVQQKVEQQLGKLAQIQNTKPQGGFPRDTENSKHVIEIKLRSGKYLSNRLLKKNFTAQVQLIPQQVESKFIDKSDMSQYPNSRVVDQVTERLLPLFPQSFKKAKDDSCFKKFFGTFREHHIDFSLLDLLQGIPKYAKYMKDVMTNKVKLPVIKKVELTQKFSSLEMKKMPKKLRTQGV